MGPPVHVYVVRHPRENTLICVVVRGGPASDVSAYVVKMTSRHSIGLLGHFGLQPDGHYCSSFDRCMDSTTTIIYSASHERGGGAGRTYFNWRWLIPPSVEITPSRYTWVS